MSEDKNDFSGNGLSLSYILFVVFLVLKLTGQITWSWWWVTAPLWGPVALVFVILILVVIAAIIS